MKVLALTGGHSFDRNAFIRFLEALPGDVDWREHPDAVDFITNGGLADYDVTLHYDMPGVRPKAEPPPRAYVEKMLERTLTGHGFVVMHHAIASWPLWPEWAELVGGAYLYRRGPVRGDRWPDSGYRLEVTESIRSVSSGHPVLEGIPDEFNLVDETYLCPVFEDDIEPLLRTDAAIEESVHFSSELALAGKMFSRQGWSHPAGSDLVAWTRTYRNSHVVFVQPGDDGRTLGNANYRRLVGNALTWAAKR